MPSASLRLAAACALAIAVSVTSMLAEGAQTAAHADSMIVGWHVPWAAGGAVAGANGTTEHAREWPSMPVQAVRLWDTRTAWLHLEPGRGNWQWGALDAQLSAAQEHGVKDVTLVLWGTPRWAAESIDEADAPWLGPGSAAPVKDLADWEEYVRMVAGRYKGRISAYEIGNEPNLRSFWRGSSEQLAQMCARAAKAIKEIDPGATVVAPAIAIADLEDTSRGDTYWQALASSGANIDAISFHWYPTSQSAGQLAAVTASVRDKARKAGLASSRVWITEVGFQGDGGMELDTARRMPAITREQAQGAGVERMYWYAWTGDKIPGVLPIRDASVLGEAIKALG